MVRPILIGIGYEHMANFTPIVAGLDWQHVNFINELRGAWSERRQSIGGAPVADVVAGHDIQSVSFWKDMQEWCENNCASFVNHNETIAGQSSVPMFSVPSWRDAAGMNSQGFRRTQIWNPSNPGDWENDIAFEHGFMEEGDIIGPWIFDDLQKAFTALKWTQKASQCDDSQMKTLLNSSTFNCAWWGRANHIAAYLPRGWETNIHGPYVYGAMGRIYHKEYQNWRLSSVRYRGTPKVTGVSTIVPCSCDIYFLPITLIWGGSGVFADADSRGMRENQLWRAQTLPVAQLSTRTGSQFSPSEVSPVDTIPVTCGDVPNEKDNAVKGVRVASTYFIFKWNFTNSD